MNLERGAVLHDAASLFRFVDSICSVCKRSGEFPSYLSLSADNVVAFNAERQKLATLRLTWFHFHKYVRPAVAAHSLNVPFPLLLSLLRRFRLIQGMDDKDFVIFHTDTVNYFEAHAPVRGRANELRRLIPNAPDFPQHLGIIEFPYSQADSVFLNCLIAHEMGHFVFDLLPDTTSDLLLQTIGNNIKSVFGTKYSQLTDAQVRWCRDKLLDWIEEVFCDFFAIWLVGPCFSLAYIELLDLSVGLYPSSGTYTGSPSFTDSHPATLFRLKEHVRLLKLLGWWPEVLRYRSHYIRLLEQAALTPTTSARFKPEDSTNNNLADKTLEAFFLTTPQIQDVVQEVMVGVDCGLNAYLRYHGSIEQYLRQGVIPSTVMLGNSLLDRGLAAMGLAPSPRREHPEFVSIINAAHKFYLESFPQLVGSIAGADDRSCADRNKWLKRLEAWTMKAIEDSELFAGSRSR